MKYFKYPFILVFNIISMVWILSSVHHYFNLNYSDWYGFALYITYILLGLFSIAMTAIYVPQIYDELTGNKQ